MSKIYSMWFHELGIAETIKKKIVEECKSFKSIFDMTEKDYSFYGLRQQAILNIIMSKKEIDQFYLKEKRCDKEGINILDYLDEDYPKYLRAIDDPPMLLYVKGNVALLNTPSIGIVGSRNCSEYGYDITVKMAEELASMGLTIISGMAMGIDAAAHYGALRAGGNTVAILGTGVNRCYPSCNHKIYNEIIEKGCIVSEYALDSLPLTFHFPKRNRIISGMVMSVLVTEAAMRSGSLITAQLALEYNREVCAIPGNITRKLSLGTNELIKNGAKCVTSIEDVIEELPAILRIKYEEIKKNSDKKHIELAQEERIVYAYVSQEPIFLNELMNRTQLPYEKIYTALQLLQRKQLIKRLLGERYVRVE